MAWAVRLLSKHNGRPRVVSGAIFSTVEQMNCGEQVGRLRQSRGFCA